MKEGSGSPLSKIWMTESKNIWTSGMIGRTMEGVSHHQIKKWFWRSLRRISLKARVTIKCKNYLLLTAH